MGISRGAIISLILKYIGGSILIPSIKISTEGSPSLRQLLSLVTSFVISKMVNQLNNSSTFTQEIFQNPVNSIADSTISSIASINSSLTTNLTGLVDAGKIANITSLYLQISNATSNIQLLTNNISGVTFPDFEKNGSAFGLNDVTGVINHYNGISATISDSVNNQYGNVKNIITLNISNVVAPISFTSRLTEIKSNIEIIKDNLITEAGGAGFDGYYSNAIVLLQNYRNEIINKHDDSVNSMTNLTNGIDVGNNVYQIGNAYKYGGSATTSLLDVVVKSNALSNIKTDFNIT